MKILLDTTSLQPEGKDICKNSISKDILYKYRY